MERENYIDAVKGFAALSVVYIHTVFFSGESYVPEYVRNISLFIDVPIFYLLSGLTSSLSIEKVVKKLIKLQITYMIFVTLFYILTSFIEKNISASIIHWFLHDYVSAPSDCLTIVMRSMWFLSVYMTVTFFGVLILVYLSKKQVLILIGLILFGFIFFFLNHIYFGFQDVRLRLFYLLIFLVGSQLKNITINSRMIILGYFSLLVLSLFVFLYQKDDVIVLQTNKFRPDFVYLVVSLFSLFTVLVLRKRLTFSKNNFLVWVGQRAIFFYFAQGISSSILYLLVKSGEKMLDWYLLLPIMFALNVAMAIIIVYLLQKVDKLGWKIIYRIKRATC